MADLKVKSYTESEIAEHVGNYADYHGITEVDVTRTFAEDGTIIGFRLSPGDGTACTGADERFGSFGEPK